MSTVLTDEEAKQVIAENVTKRLHALGWNQKRLAQETRENEMTISRVVRGQNIPGSGLLSRIAEALDVTADDLLATRKKLSRTG